jgi:choline dehydrogenase
MAALYDYDYIVIGSGAGGGPLACNLALHPNGYRVALLEAGIDPADRPGTPTYFNYSVPGLHTRATEDPRISWEFFVQHYHTKDRQTKDYDTKYNQKHHGIFYPRAAAVGGCTAHHAMITVYPHRADWEKMKELTGCDSWSADRMRAYFERLEDCQYLRRPDPNAVTDPATKHGFGGWLPLSMPDPTVAFKDEKLLQILMRAFLVGEIDVQLPEGHRGVGDLKAILGSKEKTAEALKQAVERLLKAAQRAAQRLPKSAQETLAMLRPEIEKLLNKPAEPGGKKVADVAALLSAYVREPTGLIQLFQLALAWLDPNRSFPADHERVGAYSTPASIRQGFRTGVRERILDVQARFPDRLHLITGALVTKVHIDKDKRAWGVHYRLKEGIYKATPADRPRDPWDDKAVQERDIYVRPNGEVILAGGAFNTPQLLMLSGVGDRKHLEAAGVPKVVCHLPGVGCNLQDRYEIGVVCEFQSDEKFKGFTVLQGSTFHAPGDGCGKDKKPAPGQLPEPDAGLVEWFDHRGVYASNGVAMIIIKRSAQAEKENGTYVPDLFIFGLPGYFKGYYKGYSCHIQSEERNGERVENHRRFTWAILKGRTRNRKGVVRLRSANPLDRPVIDFHYFDQGTEGWEKDRDALIEAVRFVEVLMADQKLKAEIVWPRAEHLEDDKTLGEFILKEAWGHHACGTCQIGKDGDKNAVLDKDFRVRGVKNLRVVDASVFPQIPGFFIITSIYMISEKASDVIVQDREQADRGKPRDWPPAPAE